MPKDPSPARSAVIKTLEAARQTDDKVENVLTEKCLQLSPGDRRLAYALLGGRYRNLLFLDYVLKKYISGSFKSVPPIVKEILRTGVYQLVLMDKIPSYVAISESQLLCESFGFKGLKNLVTALLFRVDRDGVPDLPSPSVNKIKWLSIKYSHPEWLINKMLKEHDPVQVENLMKWDNEIPPLWIRLNPLKVRCEDFIESLKNEELEFEVHKELDWAIKFPVTQNPRLLPGYNKGWFVVQDLGAMIAAPLLNPKPEETVIEIGSAPGGKTTHMAILQEDRGKIFATDSNPVRMRRLTENCSRLGLKSVDFITGSTSHKGLPEKVDAILLDVPCSGLGVIRRRLDLRWRANESEIERLSKIQEKLIISASGYLKSGGRMVYSTCTLTPEENQYIISKFIESNPEFEIEDPRPYLPESFYNSIMEDNTVLLWPPECGCDGGFLARLLRKK